MTDCNQGTLAIVAVIAHWAATSVYYVHATMGNAQLGLWHTRALGRLNASQEKEPGTRRRAEETLEHARVTLMNPDTRRRAEDTYQLEKPPSVQPGNVRNASHF